MTYDRILSHKVQKSNYFTSTLQKCFQPSPGAPRPRRACSIPRACVSPWRLPSVSALAMLAQRTPEVRFRASGRVCRVCRPVCGALLLYALGPKNARLLREHRPLARGSTLKLTWWFKYTSEATSHLPITYLTIPTELHQIKYSIVRIVCSPLQQDPSPLA